MIMKLREGFITHETETEQIIVAAGSVTFPGLIRNNRTAAFIVELLKEDVSREQIVYRMFAKYDASREVIAADVDKILEVLRSLKALDE